MNDLSQKYYNFVLFSVWTFLAVATSQDTSNVSSFKQPAIFFCVLMSMGWLYVILKSYFEDSNEI